MKSILSLTARKLAIILGLASLIATPGFAQQSNWKIDAEHSTAAIYIVGRSTANLRSAP